MTTDKEKTKREIRAYNFDDDDDEPEIKPALGRNTASGKNGTAKDLVRKTKGARFNAQDFRKAPSTTKRTSYVSDKNPTGEQKQKKTDTSISKTAKAVIRLVAVALILILTVSMWTSFSGWTFNETVDSIRLSFRDMSAMRGSAKKFPVPLSGTIAIKEEKLAGGTAVLTDTAMTVYNKKGMAAIITPHYMANPAMHTNGHYALVYDVGGERFRVETASGTLTTGKTESNIISACIARCGRYAIVSEESTRLSQVYVYDSDGNALFGWHSADYYINSVALSDSGKYLTVCGLNASEGVICSAVIVFSIDDNAEIARQVFEDELLLDVGYTKSGCAIAVGEKKVICISDDAKTINKTELGSKVCAYDIDNESGAAVCTSDIDCSVLRVFDTRGRERFTAKTDDAVTDVSMSGNHVCVLLQGAAKVFNSSGDLKQSFTTAVDANKVITIGNKAFILCNTVLRMEALD